MSLHCPGWILCIFCANTARETLLYSAPINTIVKKYTAAIDGHYSEISPDFIQVCAEKMLASLVEVDAGSAAEEIIRGYIHKKLRLKMMGLLESYRECSHLSSKEKKHRQDQKSILLQTLELSYFLCAQGPKDFLLLAGKLTRFKI